MDLFFQLANPALRNQLGYAYAKKKHGKNTHLSKKWQRFTDSLKRKPTGFLVHINSIATMWCFFGERNPSKVAKKDLGDFNPNFFAVKVCVVKRHPLTSQNSSPIFDANLTRSTSRFNLARFSTGWIDEGSWGSSFSGRFDSALLKKKTALLFQILGPHNKKHQKTWAKMPRSLTFQGPPPTLTPPLRGNGWIRMSFLSTTSPGLTVRIRTG